MTGRDAMKVRQALAALPGGTSHSAAPRLRDVYFPQSHLKALHPDVAVVTGTRGAGKTFWWSALQEKQIRELIHKHDTRTGINDQTILRSGFGVRPAPDQYPSKGALNDLLGQGVDARIIWRTVQAWQLAPKAHRLRTQESWQTRANYVQDNSEEIDRLFEEQDAVLTKEHRHCIVLYDSLDRSADDWDTVYRVIGGLVQVALEMRSYRRIRVKMFLCKDQVNPVAMGGFPDASKVLSSAVELNWPRRELYGLLWHLLGNAKRSPVEVQRLIYEEGHARKAPPRGGVWRVPDSLVFDEIRQRQMFGAIAGDWMGEDFRRGCPYTWIPDHLSDTEGKVSPRSFIAALSAAAKHSVQEHPGHEYPLHHDSIKRGVQRASRIRVAELGEDYPWVDMLLQDLPQGIPCLAVPCDFEDFSFHWEREKRLTRLRKAMDEQEVKLPPYYIEGGADGVRVNLEMLNVFQRLQDGRVNMPDVYRVGYGFGRRGGVRPVR